MFAQLVLAFGEAFGAMPFNHAVPFSGASYLVVLILWFWWPV
jgi:hypothetical protein